MEEIRGQNGADRGKGETERLLQTAMQAQQEDKAGRQRGRDVSNNTMAADKSGHSFWQKNVALRLYLASPPQLTQPASSPGERAPIIK